MLMDKRHVYDWDTRVHLLVRGPGVPAGVHMPFAATFVDLAPTFLDIAGVAVPARMDGRSLLPLLHADADATRAWRSEVYIEYYYVDDNAKCVQNCSRAKEGDYPRTDSSCTSLLTHAGCWGPPACNVECYATESPANNFRAIRQIGQGGDSLQVNVAHTTKAARAWPDASAEFLYAEFATGDQDKQEITFDEPDFFELYNMSTDTWHQLNIYGRVPNATRTRLHARLSAWFECAGNSCP